MKERTVMTPRLLEMRTVQKTVQPRIDTEGLPLLGARLNAKDEENYLKPSVRAYFISKLHQHLVVSTLMQTLTDNEAMKIAAVGEYCITIMYLENHFKDNKYGVYDEPSRLKNRAEKAKTTKALFRYIDTEFQGAIHERITQAVNKLFLALWNWRRP